MGEGSVNTLWQGRLPLIRALDEVRGQTGSDPKLLKRLIKDLGWGIHMRNTCGFKTSEFHCAVLGKNPCRARELIHSIEHMGLHCIKGPPGILSTRIKLHKQKQTKAHYLSMLHLAKKKKENRFFKKISLL